MMNDKVRDGVICDPVKIRDYCASIFTRNGVPKDDAYVVADSLVAANLRVLILMASHGWESIWIALKRNW